MNTKRLSIYITLFLLLVTIVAIGAFSFVNNNAISSFVDTPAESYGKYTFQKSMVLNSGEEVEFFESGDEYFRYYHDASGFVLIRDGLEKTLTYGTLVDGKVVSSGISFSSSEKDIFSVDKLTASEIDFSLNPELLSKIDRGAPYGGQVSLSSSGDEMITVNQRPLLALDPADKRTITNVVILVKFNDTPQAVVDSAISVFDSYFNNTVNSLKNYYETMSNNQVTINSYLPRETNLAVYVHNGGNRSYYDIEASNTIERRTRESQLLGGAVSGAQSKFNLTGKDLDINDDGYIDSVSFLICGDNEDTWGGLLWPHSWNLDSIDGASTSYIGAYKVGDYSLNFTTSINVGVLCHEMGHVLGAPDLYHYEYDFVPVGKWDLMGSNTSMPQYMLTYMRDKYVGGIGSGQIVDIISNGIYTLAPVSTSYLETDVLSYKIRRSDKPNEYFMIEYRNPIISSRYDSSLPSTGLIVYRVRETNVPAGQSSPGNRDAKFESSNYPDEVYVFRPLVTMNPDGAANLIYNASARDIEKANLSPQNPYFRSIGNASGIDKWNYSYIFFSDGDNSKVVIEALSVNSEQAQFRVSLSDNYNVIEQTYFDGKIGINQASFYNATDWAGVRTELNIANSLNLSYLANIKVELLNSSNAVIATNNLNLSDFNAKYNDGQRIFECPFVARDKGNVINTSFYLGSFLSESVPAKLRISVTNAEGYTKETISSYAVTTGGAYTWQDILDSDSETLARVFAAPQISIGIDNNGLVQASGSASSGIWGIRGEENISAVAVGRKHLLALSRNMTVSSYGENFFGEMEVSGWTNVKQVAAGDYTSYALLSDGTVIGVGVNDYLQLQVGSWRNIVAITAGARHIIGLDSNGNLFAAGDNSSGQCAVSGVTGVKEISAGESFTAVLKTNGSVQILGNFPYTFTPSAFTNVVSIASGSRHILALLENGTVVASGDNTNGQCNVTNLYDIISLDGGENHSIYLREDGFVEYRGQGNPQYETNTAMTNLLILPENYIQASSISTPDLEGVDSRILKNGSKLLTVTVSPQDATYQRVVFTSSDPSIVSVNMFAEGTSYKVARLYGQKVGSAVITARINGTTIASQITITVYEEKPLTAISFDYEVVTLIKTKTVKLNHTLVPLDATNVGIATPSYSSSDTAVATVDQGTGVVTGLEAGVAEITISITVGGITYTDICVVTIVEETVTIDVTQSQTPLKIRHNGVISLNYLTMNVTIGAASPIVVPVKADMLSSYNSSVIGEKQVTVTYMGASDTISVSVLKYVSKIEFDTEPKKQYKYDEPLSSEGNDEGIIKATFSDASTSLQNVNIAKVFGYNPTLLGDQVLTIKFSDPNFGNDLEIFYTITVLDVVESVIYTPRQSTYIFGSSFSNTEQLTLNMASSTVRSEDFDSPNITFSGFNGSIRGSHLISVEYTDKANNNAVLNAPKVVINVAMAGSFAYPGKDNVDYIHYFEHSSSIPIDIYFVQGQGSRISVKEKATTPNFWYQITGFNNQLIYQEGNDETQQNVTYGFYTTFSRVDGEVVTITDELFESVVVTARGLAPISGWVILTPEGQGTLENPIEYEYSSGPLDPAPSPEDIQIRKTLSAGGTITELPMETRYDRELVGATQQFGARYLGTWKYVYIKITDIPEYVEDIPTQTVKYGERLDINVYVNMKKRGSTLISPVLYSLTFKNNSDQSLNSIEDYSTKLGFQTVTLVYSDEGYSLTKTFQMEIIDVFSFIDMLDPPKADYKYGETFAPETGKFRLNMRSGAYVDEFYNATDYSFTPEFNSEPLILPSNQTITIRYNPDGIIIKTWNIYCTVRNYVKTLSVALTKTEYKFGDPLELEVRAIYANGANTKLNQGTYQTSYNPNLIGEQAVVFGYLDASTTKIVHVSDIVQQISINTLPTKRTYGYGEALDFWGMRVTVKYQSGSADRSLQNSVVGDELKVTYNPLSPGIQPVIIAGYVGGESTSFSVEVYPDDNTTLSGVDSSSIKVYKTESIIAVSTDNQAVTNLDGRFNYAAYLTPTILDKNNVELNPLTTRNLRTGDKVRFLNADGVTIYQFEVNVFGDSNGDGSITQSDLDSMANRVLAGENKKYVMDYNSDGKSTLTDIVLFARKINGN